MTTQIDVVDINEYTNDNTEEPPAEEVKPEEVKPKAKAKPRAKAKTQVKEIEEPTPIKEEEAPTVFYRSTDVPNASYRRRNSA